MKYLAVVAALIAQGHALCCSDGVKCDSSTWESAFGNCASYEKTANPSNYGYCALDTDKQTGTILAQTACPAACDACELGETRSPTSAPTLNCSPTDATCCDDPTFWSGYGDCSSYTTENYQYCQTDMDASTGSTALNACKVSCKNCPGDASRSPTAAPTRTCDPTDTSCCNDPSWASVYGDCSTYVAGTTNYLNCANDTNQNGRYAYEGCPVSCGVCNGATPGFPTKSPTTVAPTSAAPTPALTPAPTNTPAPTDARTPAPTNTPAPTDARTPAPTNTPATPAPTDARTPAPTNTPATPAPTTGRTPAPTIAPVSRPPTDTPATRAPVTKAPTDAPSPRPTRAPIVATPNPTRAPI